MVELNITIEPLDIREEEKDTKFTREEYLTNVTFQKVELCE